MSEPTRHDIIKIFRERQDKFVYYITGLNIAAVGFTLSKTYDKVLFQYIDLFLAISLLSFLFSIAAALMWINMQFKGMNFDMYNFDLNAGVLDEVFTGHEDKDEKTEAYKAFIGQRLQDDMKKSMKITDRSYKSMLALFFIGVVFFVAWRIASILTIV